jgi:hypothetical protein
MFSGKRVTRTDYGHPHRPLPIRLINRLGNIGNGIDAAKLSSRFSDTALLDQAGRKEGLSDFGDPSFRPGLRALMAAIESEARLTPVGRWITRKRLLGALRNRLRAEKLFRDHPEILNLRIEPPIVITGMQRTGTTLLHRLLAADPDTRALLGWEALNPAPYLTARSKGRDAGERGRHDRDPRIRIARLSQRALALMAPDFFAVHPVEVLSPEEDVLLLDYSFLSTVPEATLRVPGFSRWLEAQDVLPAYRYLKKLLQLLQWQRPGKRWVLKSPHHLEYLDMLFTVFPGAKIVQTHRDPAITQASFCSMIAHGRGVFSDAVDPTEIGREWLRKVGRLVKRALEARRRWGEDRFLDVYYRDLVHNPMEQIERVYDFAGISLLPHTREKIDHARSVNVRNKFGIHNYRLGDFGLTRETVAAEFSEYRERFSVSELTDA